MLLKEIKEKTQNNFYIRISKMILKSDGFLMGFSREYHSDTISVYDFNNQNLHASFAVERSIKKLYWNNQLIMVRKNNEEKFFIDMDNLKSYYDLDVTSKVALNKTHSFGWVSKSYS